MRARVAVGGLLRRRVLVEGGRGAEQPGRSRQRGAGWALGHATLGVAARAALAVGVDRAGQGRAAFLRAVLAAVDAGLPAVLNAVAAGGRLAYQRLSAAHQALAVFALRATCKRRTTWAAAAAVRAGLVVVFEAVVAALLLTTALRALR